MSLSVILCFATFALVYWLIVPPMWRQTVLLVMSVIFLYALQPSSPASGVSFILPSVLILMVIGVAWIVRPPARQFARIAMVTLIGLSSVIGLTIAVPQSASLIAIIHQMVSEGVITQFGFLVVAVILFLVFLLAYRTVLRNSAQTVLLSGTMLSLAIWVGQTQTNTHVTDRLSLWLQTFYTGIPDSARIFIGILAVAVVIPVLIPRLVAQKWRYRIALIWIIAMTILLYGLKINAAINALGASSTGTTLLDLQWIGISYILFRLLHVLFDFRAEALDVSFNTREFLTYAIFFPTLLAGPISRVDEVIPQLHNAKHEIFRLSYLYNGGWRLIIGIFKKFVVAGFLSLIALGPNLFPGTGERHFLALLIMLYAEFLLFYFDFSGYSDIAIGLGQIFGIGLPENFDRPFSRPNIQLFWQSWHITLSTWFRQYWFNPLSRLLLKTRLKKRQNAIILIAQLSTMMFIGLWHQFSLNWLMWGVINGLGLWAYKIISDRTKKWFRKQTGTPRRFQIATTVNAVITFHFVLISFSFVAFPTVNQTIDYWFAILGIRR